MLRERLGPRSQDPRKERRPGDGSEHHPPRVHDPPGVGRCAARHGTGGGADLASTRGGQGETHRPQPRPINLETPLKDLGAEITANELFFVRNNYDGPEIDPAQYALKVDGEVDNPLTLSLADLRRAGPMVTETITLECAGNGRGFYNPKAPGLQWENGAVGTAIWGGIRLSEVLRLAQPRPSAAHVVPDGNDGPPTPQAPDFIRSHPLWKAQERHTMLALEMNGKPLPHLHGGPVRLIVPGWVGSASIKWLTRLSLASAEWNGPVHAAKLPLAARRRPGADVFPAVRWSASR